MTEPLQDALYEDQRLVAVYDALNASRDDFDFYLRHLPVPPSQVLDIGCGTGRFSVDLARQGYHVTACDPAVDMVDYAQARPDAALVAWHHGAVGGLPSYLRFDAAVMTGHAFQCLLSDEDMRQFFEVSRSHLVEKGVLMFESRNPKARAWDRWKPDHAGPPVDLGAGQSVAVTHEVITHRAPYVTFEERYHFLPDNVEKRSVSTLRFASEEEILSCAEGAGFQLVQLCGDWSGAPFEADQTPEMIFKFLAV
ncbi:class I SAM-dependent methyltransferase [Shimia sp. MMG029]|uniref:class I SAM-dependent methyltransferase n=1 Tax=Shimia sp. MMG029 TaxID=3021978 RepID=UPI0022FDC11D|nr:class I SAM-dependent methyltransferase [Shimia sp. MMG029]MDA5558847.1 class I SAM-dependent methyltransferase [Shimia sp. MMG029]